MKGRALMLFVGLLAGAGSPAATEPVAEVFQRSPRYYVMRFGFADSTVESERWTFLHPGTDGFTEVPGRFSAQRFHDREVAVEAVFHRPYLELAGVTIRRPARWKREDVDRLLAEYGARWRQVGPQIWVSAEGVRAIYRDGLFHLLSPRIVGEMDAEWNRKQEKARPGS